MTDRIRVKTSLNLRPAARQALEALAIDLGCSMVQAAEMLLALPHRTLVLFCQQGEPMRPEEMLLMWLKDNAESRYARSLACKNSYRSGKLVSVVERMAAVHRAAGDVYASALRELEAAKEESGG